MGKNRANQHEKNEKVPNIIPKKSGISGKKVRNKCAVLIGKIVISETDG